MDNIAQGGRFHYKQLLHDPEDEVCQGGGKSIGRPSVSGVATILLMVLGWLVAHAPYKSLEVFASLAGRLLVLLPNPRRRTLLSNLRRAFPDHPHSRLLSLARKSAANLVEMGLLSLAYHSLSRDQRRRMLLIPSATERLLHDLRRSHRPVVFFLPHVTHFEMPGISPHFRPGGSRSLGAIYRPNSNPAIDALVLASRRNAKLRLFPRDTALNEAKAHLRKNNWLAVLFDQNAGVNGTLSTFLGRIASTTPLPALLAIGTQARAVCMIPERTAFFQSTFHMVEMDPAGKTDLTTQAHEILASHLLSSDQACADWLWTHARWKTQNIPKQHLRLRAKRSNLPETENMPKKTKFVIRMPNWLGDVVMSLPHLRALRQARPDAEITLLCLPAFLPLLEDLAIADRLHPLPSSRKLLGILDLLPLRREFPDLHLLFTHSLRGDLEALLLGAPRRYGVLRPGRRRPLLTHAYSATQEDIAGHQTNLWESFLRHFGMESELDLSPFSLPRPAEPTGASHITTIALAPGSSNNPEKRYPPEQWLRLARLLLDARKDLRIHLLGGIAEHQIAQAIACRLPAEKVKNLAGQTNLADLARELTQTTLFIGNDSGGMHLANALGVPLLALFGPTDPRVTGPAFHAPFTVLHPPGEETAETSPSPMSKFQPEKVARAALRALENTSSP